MNISICFCGTLQHFSYLFQGFTIFLTYIYVIWNFDYMLIFVTILCLCAMLEKLARKCCHLDIWRSKNILCLNKTFYKLNTFCTVHTHNKKNQFKLIDLCLVQLKSPSLHTKAFRLKNWSIIVSIHDLSSFERLHKIFSKKKRERRRGYVKDDLNPSQLFSAVAFNNILLLLHTYI